MLISRLKFLGHLAIATAIVSLGFSISIERFNFLPFQNINQVIAQNSINTRQKRIALVIGNANYQVGKLDTPLNDAMDMADTLKELDFEVILLKDASKREMNDALDQFSTRINQGYVGLFYFAGHGMQVEGDNYLIPVNNAQIKAEKDIEYESMSLGKILGRMQDAGNQINIVILDACRDNPFRKFWRSSSRGLTTPIQPASGTLIAFATAPGKVASDGIGRNGLFTSYLLKYIKTPNLDVDLMLRQVRSNVAKDTKNYQVPWNSSSLTGEFAFNQKAAITSSVVTSSPVPNPSPTLVSTPQPQISPSPQLTAKTFYDAGLDKYNAGDYEAAIFQFTESIQIDTTNSDAYVYRGISKRNLKDYQGAISDYNQAIKLKPDYARAYYGRGLSKSDLGDEQEAITDYNQAIKLKPDYAEVYHNRGVSKSELGDYLGAITDYDQAIKLKSDYTKAYYGRGLAKSNLGDYQGAIADYTQAIKLKPDYAEVYYGRGLAKSNLGDYQGAIADYTQVIKLKPDYAGAYYMRGSSNKNLGDHWKAIDNFRQAAKLYQQQNNQTWYQKSLDRLKELGVFN